MDSIHLRGAIAMRTDETLGAFVFHAAAMGGLLNAVTVDALRRRSALK